MVPSTATVTMIGVVMSVVLINADDTGGVSRSLLPLGWAAVVRPLASYLQRQRRMTDRGPVVLRPGGRTPAGALDGAFPTGVQSPAEHHEVSGGIMGQCAWTR